MKRNAVPLIAAAILIGGACLAICACQRAPAAHQATTRYESAHAGIAFTYPQTYSAEFSHENDGVEAWHMVTVREGVKPPPSPGPAGARRITISVFPNPDGLAPEKWMKSSSHAMASASEVSQSNNGSDPMITYIDAQGAFHAAVAVEDRIYYYSVIPADDRELMDVFRMISATVSYPEE